MNVYGCTYLLNVWMFTVGISFKRGENFEIFLCKFGNKQELLCDKTLVGNAMDQ